MRLHRFWTADFGLPFGWCLRIVEDDSQNAVLNPRVARWLLWLLAGCASAVVAGWFAAKIHASGHAPLGLTSLGVGAMLGAALAAIAAKLRFAGLTGLLATALLFAILTIAAEHAWLYVDFRGQWKESRTKSPAVAIFRPEEPPAPREYFARDWNPQLWFADAAIITATTLAILLIARRYVKIPDLRPPTSDP